MIAGARPPCPAMNLRKSPIAFASSSSASITSSSGAQGSEDFRLHIAVKQLIGRRCLPHQAWRRLSGGAVAFLGPERRRLSGGAVAFLGPERRRPTVYYSSSLSAAPAPARRLHGSGGGGRPGGSRRSPSSAPATVRPRELWSARRPWLEWCRQKEGTGGE